MSQAANLADGADPVVRRPSRGREESRREASAHANEQDKNPAKPATETTPAPVKPRTAEEEMAAALMAVNLDAAKGQRAGAEPTMPSVSLLHYRDKKGRRRRYSPERQRVSLEAGSTAQRKPSLAVDSASTTRPPTSVVAPPTASQASPAPASQRPRIARLQRQLEAEATGVGDALCLDGMRMGASRLDSWPQRPHVPSPNKAASPIGSQRRAGAAPWATFLGTGLQPPGCRHVGLLAND
jgi:hypothetical protein